MSNFKQNGILFTIANNFQQGEKVHNVKGKISSVNYPYSLYEEDDASKLINAVEIDWNSATICNQTVNTTGQLLSILQTAYNYATTYTGKTSLVSGTTELAKINGQSLKFGGSITIETGTDYTHPTFSGVTGSYGTSAAATLAHGGKFNVPYITVNNNGHITAVKSIALTLPAAQTSVTGNAGTATKLATARTLTIGSTGKTFDGSANVAWTLSEIGAAAAVHTHDDYTTKSYVSTNYAAKVHSHDNYTTYAYIIANYAKKNHEHADLAPADHTHTDLAAKNHASTATTFGVGTSANYGHLKISNAYSTQSNAADVALSLGGAYNMFNHFMTKIASLQTQIDELQDRVTTLEGYHVTKEYDLTVSLTGCSSTTLKTGKISENGGTYTVTANTHYNLPSSITVKQGTTTLTAGTHYTWSSGSLRILPGITGAISVTITATAKSYTITVSGNATGNKSSVTYTSGDVQVTLTPKTGYTVTGASVTGATYVSFSNNIVTFKSMTGNVTITAQTSEIVLTGVTVSKTAGTGTLSSDTVSLTGKGSSITLNLDSTPDTALTKTMTLAATNSADTAITTLGLSASSVSDGGTVKLTPTAAISSAKLKISNNKGTALKTLTVNVADGTTTALTVKNSSGTTSSDLSASGGNITLTATVTTTRFATQTVNWSITGGTGGKLSATTGSSITFTAPANTSETATATHTIQAACDGKTATYTVTVAKKAASTKYYWYVGQTNPASMTSISPVVSDNTSPGWRLIGTSVPSYSDTNMLWDGVTNNIQVDKESGERAQYFVAVPNNKIQIYNGLKGSEMSNYDTSEITISGVKYYVYSYKSKGRVFGMNLY